MFNSIGGQCGIGAPISEQIGGESFIRHIGSDKLIFDFKEGSGTTVYDKSHNGNNGTLADKDSGSDYPTWLRNSLSFDGANNYVDCGNDSSLDLNILSVEIILYPTYNGTHTIIGSHTDANNYVRYTNDDGEFTVYGRDGGNLFRAKMISQYTVNNWYSLTYTIGNLEVPKIYTNGILQITDNDSNDAGIDEHILFGNLFIGLWHVADPRPFKGTIKKIHLCSKVLSQIEIQQNYLVQKFRGNN